jgi:O-antigen/teichoic acid export membrane protein
MHYALATFCLKGIGLIMLPVVTHFLPPAEYGLLNFLVSIVAMLSIVLSFGFAEVLFRFTPEMPAAKIPGFINACLRLSVVIAVLFFSITMLFLDIIVGVLPVKVEHIDLALLFFNLSISLILGIFLTAFRLQKKSRKYLITALTQGVTQAVLTAVFLMLGWSVTGVLLSGVIAVTTVTVLLLLRHLEVWTQKTEKITLVHVKYASLITLSALFLYALSGAENWFIAGILGTEQLTVYFVAAQFSLVLSVMFEPFRMWWFPQRFERYFASAHFAAKGAVTGCIVICLLASGMMVFGPTVIRTLLPSAYSISADYLPILCVILVIKTFTELLNLGCYLETTAKYVPLINGLAAILALFLIAIGTQYFGIYGVFSALGTVHIIRFIMFYFTSQRLATIPYNLAILCAAFSMIIVQFILLYISIWCALCWFIWSVFIAYFMFYKSGYCLLADSKHGEGYELSGLK